MGHLLSEEITKDDGFHNLPDGVAERKRVDAISRCKPPRNDYGSNSGENRPDRRDRRITEGLESPK
jgi:hypothetical protein